MFRSSLNTKKSNNMKKQALLFALLLAGLTAAFGQKNHASNMKLADIDDEKVTITFDLLPSGQYRTFNICLRSSNANITPKSTTGDIGQNRTAGTNKKIVWVYANDGYTQDQIANLKLNVIAINPAEPRSAGGASAKPSVPLMAGMGTVAAAGLGLAIAGVTANKDALDQYDIYKTNLDPNSQVYTELDQTRDEVYDDANKKHKKAQILLYGGGAVFAAAGYILINRLIWAKRAKEINRQRSSAPELQCSRPQPRFELTPATGSGFGVGLAYRF